MTILKKKGFNRGDVLDSAHQGIKVSKGFVSGILSPLYVSSNMADMFNESNRSASGYTSSLINDVANSDYKNYLSYRLLINI